jgi:hypothetical protein
VHRGDRRARSFAQRRRALAVVAVIVGQEDRGGAAARGDLAGDGIEVWL